MSRASRIPLPTARWFAIAAVATTAFAVGPGAGVVAWAVLIVAWLVDGRRSATTSPLRTSLALPPRVSLGEEAVASVRIERQGGRSAKGLVSLELDGALATDDATAIRPFTAAPRAEVAFTLRAKRRGTRRITAVHLVVRGPLGLAIARERRPVDAEVIVVPGLAVARRLELLHESGRRAEAGRHRTRLRDDAGEFDALREYQRGDDTRRIDWKSTARRGTTMVRTMTAERRQDLVIAIDQGRALREAFQGQDRLDHAIAAAVGLAAAAGAYRDNVGWMGFAGEVVRFVPPSARPMGTIVRELAALEARADEPDYRGALLELAQRLPRRALIVVLSDVVDGEVSEPLVAGLALLRRRHLPLLVALRSPATSAALAEPVRDELSALRRAALLELVRARRAVLANLRRRGVEVVDSPAADAAGDAVEAYLALKRRGAL